ncbi:hypothetical protein OSTOST_09645 [Ostertagia ostertagi]
MNKNLFLLLCNDLGVAYDITLDHEHLVLSKRPLAHAIVKSGRFCERLSADLGLRLEIYRHLQIARSPNEFFQHVRNFAVEDLKCARNERDIACVSCWKFSMCYTLIGISLLQKNVNLPQLFYVELAEDWRMPDTIAAAYRLLAFVSEERAVTTDEMEWIKSCVNAEEELPKRIALEVGAYYLKRGSDDQLIAVLASFLQDDALHIREEASSLLSRHILKSNIVLNPGVCYRLIIENERYAKNEVTERQPNVLNESAEVLFDACSTNPYAETRTFGEFDEVKSMIAELKEI